MAFTPEQLDTLCRFAGVPANADPATIVAGIGEAVEEYKSDMGDDEWQRRVEQAVARHQTPATGAKAGADGGPSRGHAPVAGSPLDDPVDWAVQTGRVSEARAATFWRAEAEAERRETGSTARTEATLRALAPVYGAAGAQGYAEPASSTPMLDALEAKLYGPSDDDRERAEDLAAERELRAQLDHEATDQQREARRSRLIKQHRDYSARVAAELDDDGLTEDEERALFGPDPTTTRQAERPRAETWSLRPDGNGGSHLYGPGEA